MKKCIVVVGVLIGLSGCTGTQGERYLGRPGSPAWFATAAPETITAHYRQRCKGYGFVDGSVEMARCVQQEASQGRSRSSARVDAFVQANQTPPRPAPTTSTTNCSRFGRTVTCNTISR